MRDYLTPIVISIICLFACSVGGPLASDESETAWLTYTDREFGFKFSYPDYNEITVTNRQDSLIRRISEMYGEVPYEIENQQRLVVAASLKPMFRVAVFSNPVDMSLRDFAELWLSNLPGEDEDFLVAQFDFDGHKGIRCDGPGAGGYENISFVFLTHGEHIYTLTLLANSKSNNRFLKSFDFEDE